MAIDINALGTRDPAMCGSCNSSYTDTYTVNLFDQTGKLLGSTQEINYFYYNTYSNSHGIGAGPVWITVPAGTTGLEIESRLSIAGLLGPDRNPLGFGNLNISSDGAVTAATPIPSTLPLLASGLAVFGLLSWRRKRRRTAIFGVPDYRKQSKEALASAWSSQASLFSLSWTTCPGAPFLRHSPDPLSVLYRTISLYPG